jgi:hypothetical protein
MSSVSLYYYLFLFWQSSIDHLPPFCKYPGRAVDGHSREDEIAAKTMGINTT